MAGSNNGSEALRRAAMAGAAAAAAATVILANFQKTWWGGVQGWGRPYWWLDYHHGLIRRGLAGELFQAAFGRLPEARLAPPVAALHLVLCLFLAATVSGLLLLALARERNAGRSLLLAVAGLCVASSQFWGCLAYNLGYLDALVLACVVLAGMCIRRRLWIPAGVLMAAGPLIHEYFLFLTPFALAWTRIDPPEGSPREIVSLHTPAAARGAARPLLALAAVAAASGAAVAFGANAAASQAEIAAMPLSPEDRRTLLETTLGQGFGQSFAASTGQMLRDPAFTARAFAFFLAPSAVAAGATLLWMRGGPRPALLARAAAGLFPAAALLLAWDLSRLLVATNFTAGVLLLLTALESPPGEEAHIRPGAAVGAAALCAFALGYAALPAASVYYSPGPVTLFPLKAWPGDGVATFGLERLWTNARNAARPQALRW